MLKQLCIARDIRNRIKEEEIIMAVLLCGGIAMSDDNYNNHNDDEYWDDVYFEEHRDEYSSGWGSSGSRGIGKTILLIFLMIWGIMTMLDSPMLGIIIIMLSLVFCK